jgi:hypothetical protein
MNISDITNNQGAVPSTVSGAVRGTISRAQAVALQNAAAQKSATAPALAILAQLARRPVGTMWNFRKKAPH